MTEEKIIGLIAGQGRLPFLIARGARSCGLKVVCAGLSGSVSSQLVEEVDIFYEVALARPGSWMRKFKRHGVHKAVMVGRVAKTKLFTPGRILKYLPDWRALRIYYWRLLGKPKLNDYILGALAEELSTGGITLEDSTKYCREHLAGQGVMTHHLPQAGVKGDIAFGWPLVKKLGELDIGQALAVREREVIAVEAIEGTADMIVRAGQLCRKGGWTLLKAAKPGQDMRFDVPCVGPDTIQSLKENGSNCLVVEANKTIIIEKQRTLELADELGIAVVGNS